METDLTEQDRKPLSSAAHRWFILSTLTLLLVSFAGWRHPASAQSYTYQTVALPVPGVTNAWVSGLTDKLTAVGSYTTYDERTETYTTKYWHFQPGKGFRTLTEPGKDIYVQDINAGGRIVGTYQDSTGKWHGFTRRSGKDFRRLSLPDADVGGCRVNDEATIVCGYMKASGEQGSVFWRATWTPKLLRIVPRDPEEVRLAISYGSFNNYEDQAGYFEWAGESFGPYRGVIRDGATGELTFVDGPPCGGVMIWDMNDNRLLATTCINVPEEGYQRAYVTNGDEPSWTEIAVPDAYDTRVTAVNHRGQVAGSYDGPDGIGLFIATPMNLAQQ
jgi:hypothetical protein